MRAQAKTKMRKPMSRSAFALASEALELIRRHLAVCEVKHDQIAKNQEAAKDDHQAMHRENQESLRRIYGLIWKLVIGVGAGITATLVSWVATLLWYVITKGD